VAAAAASAAAARPEAGESVETDGGMKDLAAEFLNETDRERVIAAVRAAERRTSGEIVPLVVAASYHYPMADLLGALALALPAAIIGTPLIGARLWLGPDSMWVFIGLFTILFSPAQVLLKRRPALKRIFISRHDLDEEVEERAITAFFRHGLYRTREGTGVLVFVSVFERRAWILADQGINDKVPAGTWDQVVRDLIAGIRAGRQGEALGAAVTRVGAVLAEYFPIRSDDRDELRNLIVES